MTAFTQFEQSNAWDPRYKLPTVPQHNNPWIYLAYAFKMMKLGPSTNTDLVEFADLSEDFLRGCEKEVGLINRWPDGTGGLTSHDELIGASYIDDMFAKRALEYLESQDGDYNNTGEKETIIGSHNLYRFVWFVPFLKARAGYKVNLVSQVLWVTKILGDLFFYKPGDESGKLLTWIMLEDMSRQFLCGIAIYFWKRKMKKLGVSPKTLFSVYLGECPVFLALAPEEF